MGARQEPDAHSLPVPPSIGLNFPLSNTSSGESRSVAAPTSGVTVCNSFSRALNSMFSLCACGKGRCWKVLEDVGRCGRM